MSRKKIISEINVTPLVDVMLVLLIVFMITTPLLLPGINIRLPQTETQAVNTINESSLIITITKEGNFFLRDKPVSLEELKHATQIYLHNNKEAHVFIRGDKNARYDFIAQAIIAIKEIGINKITLITDTPS